MAVGGASSAGEASGAQAPGDDVEATAGGGAFSQGARHGQTSAGGEGERAKVSIHASLTLLVTWPHGSTLGGQRS